MGHVIKSAGREYFDAVERAVGLTELVELFKFPQSSAAAILKSLVVLGYLYHDRATQTYLPTARLAHLGTWASTLLIDRDDVIQLVTHLSRAVEETVVLGVQNDLMAQYIYVQLAARSVVAISLQIRAAVSERNAASEQASCRQPS
jgi:IclR family KDG regulon transcriptional repressor